MISKLDDIVTLETYYNPMLAEIIRARLEANGIPCFLTDESLGPCIRFLIRVPAALN